MDKVKHFHFKRPIVLPPLSNLVISEPNQIKSEFTAVKNRWGSPLPRRASPVDLGGINNADSTNPVIKVFEVHSEESEKCNLNFDSLSDVICHEMNAPQYNEKKDYLTSNKRELKRHESGKIEVKNLAKMQFEYSRENPNKKRPLQKIPLKGLDILNSTPECKVFEIPKRYPLLKPIQQDTCEKLKRFLK